MTPIERLADQIRHIVAKQAHGLGDVMPWRNLPAPTQQIWRDIARSMTIRSTDIPIPSPFTVLATSRMGFAEEIESIARDLYEGYHVRLDNSGKISLYHLPSPTHVCWMALSTHHDLADIIIAWTRHLRECEWEKTMSEPDRPNQYDAEGTERTPEAEHALDVNEQTSQTDSD